MQQIKKWNYGLWALWFYTLLVILWGAWVRISHSGDGCGDTWPLCHGRLIPEAERGKTWVEYTHRLMSGVYGLLMIYVYVKGRKVFNNYPGVQKTLLACLILTITEALLGAKLVLFGLVSSNDSFFRLFAMSLHQMNSLLLSGAVALAAFLSSQDILTTHPNFSVWNWFRARKNYFFIILFMIISLTGAWAALSGTLFPSDSLLKGLQDDFSADAHPVLRLRIIHPLIAIMVGAGLFLFFMAQAQKTSLSHSSAKIYRQTAYGFLIGLSFGFLTLVLLSPPWMKITHLMLAHFLWILLIRLIIYCNRPDSA